ncbi:GntR family transcriptional regulator [Thermodesulfobacteriota bacterium]
MAEEIFSEGSNAPNARSGKRSVKIYEDIRREIVLGHLAPRQALLEMELAHRFGSSQSTVREALLLLQEEGLIIRVPHRGTHVADCLKEDMIELTLLRHDIECRGIKRVIQQYGRITHRALTNIVDEMVDAAKKDDEYTLSQFDRIFHMRIYEDAGLPSVQPILHRCIVHNHRYKILNSEPRQSLLVTAERHIPIHEALDSGDEAKAVKALSHHIATIFDIGPTILPGSLIGDT